jgi:hypothetical protein
MRSYFKNREWDSQKEIMRRRKVPQQMGFPQKN